MGDWVVIASDILPWDVRYTVIDGIVVKVCSITKYSELEYRAFRGSSLEKGEFYTAKNRAETIECVLPCPFEGCVDYCPGCSHPLGSGHCDEDSCPLPSVHP